MMKQIIHEIKYCLLVCLFGDTINTLQLFISALKMHSSYNWNALNEADNKYGKY